MELTDKALKAAVKKAVEVGLLPKAGFIDVIEVNWRKVNDVVEAALAASDDDLARLSSAEQEASIEAAATEIERFRARESEIVGRIDRLNVEVVKIIDKLEMIDELDALLRLKRPTPPVPCGWARRFIRWTKG